MVAESTIQELNKKLNGLGYKVVSPPADNALDANEATLALTSFRYEPDSFNDTQREATLLFTVRLGLPGRGTDLESELTLARIVDDLEANLTPPVDWLVLRLTDGALQQQGDYRFLQARILVIRYTAQNAF